MFPFSTGHQQIKRLTPDWREGLIPREELGTGEFQLWLPHSGFVCRGDPAALGPCLWPHPGLTYPVLWSGPASSVSSAFKAS